MAPSVAVPLAVELSSSTTLELSSTTTGAATGSSTWELHCQWQCELPLKVMAAAVAKLAAPAAAARVTCNVAHALQRPLGVFQMSKRGVSPAGHEAQPHELDKSQRLLVHVTAVREEVAGGEERRPRGHGMERADEAREPRRPRVRARGKVRRGCGCYRGC